MPLRHTPWARRALRSGPPSRRTSPTAPSVGRRCRRSERCQGCWRTPPPRRRVVMAVFNLAPAPTGRIYQLWAIAAGKPMSLGLFNTAPDGRATVAMDVARELASFQLTAVTEEPVGGSPQPTQQPFLVGKLSGGE